MLDSDYFLATATKLHALKSHVDAAGQGLLASALSSLTLAQELSHRPEPSSAESTPESCQDPGCEYCVPEPEPEPEPDALDLLEPLACVLDRLVVQLLAHGDPTCLALAVEGQVLLRLSLGDYEPDGDRGDDDGEPPTGRPSGLMVVVPAGFFRRSGDQPA